MKKTTTKPHRSVRTTRYERFLPSTPHSVKGGSLTKISSIVVLVILGAMSNATGQIIPIKTVPLATGSQFSIFPSANIASGGLSVAAEDELSDPFTNPAKGFSMNGMRVLSAPQMYSVSIQRGTSEGSGFSLPLGVLAKHGDFFGGLYWARQQLSSERNSASGITPPSSGSLTGMTDDPENNTYTFAMLGTTIPGTEIAVGASALWGDLNSVEGVNLLFPRSPKVLQNGTLTHYRIGVMRTMESDRQFDAVIVRSIFKMRYDVASVATTGIGQTTTVQFNPEYDQTNLWGLQIRYTHSLENNWRVGALVTTNWKEHPKIPNYDLMSIPRDPGNSTAYNLGLGLVRSRDRSFFGADLIYEPIETATWAEADQSIRLANGDIFPAGMKTVENFFNFSNWIARFGFRAGSDTSSFQAGCQRHAINYDLEQINHLQRSKRSQHESWVEWTISGGYGFSIGPVRILYTVLLTTGTGQPTVVSAGWTGTARSDASADLYAGDFLPAPSGSLNVRKALVWTHLVSVSYRIE